MNKFIVIISTILLAGCATVRESTRYDSWQDAVRHDYAQNGQVTVNILGDGRYAIADQHVTLQDLSLIKQELLLPPNTPFVLSATPNSTHADVQALLFVIKEQYWKIKFIETK